MALQIKRIPELVELPGEVAGTDLLLIYHPATDKTYYVLASKLRNLAGIPDPANQAGKALFSDGTHAKWQNIGGRAPIPPAPKTANYTVLLTDAGLVLRFDCTAGPLTVILPAAALSAGLVFILAKIDNTTNVLNIICAGSGKVNNGDPLVLANQLDIRGFLSDATDYSPII